MFKIFIAYLIAVSLLTAVLTIYDKSAARKRAFRISEATLILCAVFGGAVAELAVMLIIRHKTKHIKFMLGLPVIIILQAAVAVGICFLAGVFNV